MLAKVANDFLAHGSVAGDDLAQDWFPATRGILGGAVPYQVQGVGHARPASGRPRSCMELSSCCRLDVVPWRPGRVGRWWRDDAGAGARACATAVVVVGACGGGTRAGVVGTSTVATDGGTSAGRRVFGNLGPEIRVDRRAVQTAGGTAESANAQRSVDGCRCGNDGRQISVARVCDAACLILMRAWAGALSNDARGGRAQRVRVAGAITCPSNRVVAGKMHR